MRPQQGAPLPPLHQLSSNPHLFHAGPIYRNQQPQQPAQFPNAQSDEAARAPTKPVPGHQADAGAGQPDRTEVYLDGDEFDRYSVGDLALIRYKMSHEYVADIFSPYSIGMQHPSLYSTRNDLYSHLLGQA